MPYIEGYLFGLGSHSLEVILVIDVEVVHIIIEVSRNEIIRTFWKGLLDGLSEAGIVCDFLRIKLFSLGPVLSLVIHSK